MNWSCWLGANYEGVRGLIRATGLRMNVRYDDLDDFTSRVFVRALATRARDAEDGRWGLIQTIARRQAVDDTRRRLARPIAVAHEHEWQAARPDPYAELEVLDAVKQLGERDGKAVLGHALGFYDRELAEEGVTLDAVSQRRRRARERMVA